MYLPRSLISHLYTHLLRTHHPLSAPVLILVTLEPDALCACRILTSLLKRDYIPHKIQPIAGYGDLARAGEQLIQPMRLSDGGNGGVAVCLGVGGLVDLESVLGLAIEQDGSGGADGVEVWVFDARRPWNLTNVFGGPSTPRNSTVTNSDPISTKVGVEQGQLSCTYRPGRGGIFVFDDGDIQEGLRTEREAWCAIEQMPEVGDNSDETDASDAESDTGPSQRQDLALPKRKSWSDGDEEDDESEKENARPRQRRRSNSVSVIACYSKCAHLTISSSQLRYPHHHLAVQLGNTSHHVSSIRRPLPINSFPSRHPRSVLESLLPDSSADVFSTCGVDTMRLCAPTTCWERHIPNLSHLLCTLWLLSLAAKIMTYSGLPLLACPAWNFTAGH